MENNKIKAMVAVMLVVLGIIFGIAGSEVYQYSETLEYDSRVDYLYNLLKEKAYFYEDDEQLDEGKLRGLIESLDDPYAVYYDEEAFTEFDLLMKSSFSGIGVGMATNGNYSLITSVIANSPAKEVGLQVGDVLLSVDGQSVYGLTVTEIATLIKGTEGTERVITIARGDLSDPIDYTITLRQITSPTVNSEIIEEDENQVVGYLQISLFGDDTDDDFVEAIEGKDGDGGLKAQGITDLIIDVRGNPGGSLTTVTHMLDYLIDTEDPFLFQKSRDGEKVPYYIDEVKSDVDYNIVVLMDENSASASEIFAATLNEMVGTDLIGVTTFGKGTVQTIYALDKEGKTGVKFTSNHWLTSTESEIHGVGIDPTIEQVNLLNNLSFVDPSEEISYDHVNKEIMDVQVLLNLILADSYFVNREPLREDGYFDTETGMALSYYQNILEIKYVEKNVTFEKSGEVDFKTAYYMNIELSNLLADRTLDTQYQAAIDYFN